jgi:outer membrane protein TolC
VRREYTRVAQEALADTRIRYQDALATAQEVLKAEATLRDCQTDYFEALYDLIIARLTWQRATGELR